MATVILGKLSVTLRLTANWLSNPLPGAAPIVRLKKQLLCTTSPSAKRAGRREGGNRIDAIVIHERDDLSPEELDVLFAEPEDEEELAPIFLLGDCNQDGDVNFVDISPFIVSLSTGEFLAEADCNQDTVVDFFDISPFIVLLSAP